MKRFLHGLLITLALALPTTVARGQEVVLPDPDHVLEVIEAGDTEALAELARRESPDPWVVADDLLLMGEKDAAAAFAKAAEGPATAKLAAYVEGWSPGPADEEARAATKQGTALLRAGDYAGALAAVEGAEGNGVLGIVITRVRGAASGMQGKQREAVELLGAAAAQAAEIGWISAAADMSRDVGGAAFRTGQPAVAVEAWQRWHELSVELGRSEQVDQAAASLGAALMQSGRGDEARPYLEHSIKRAAETGNKQVEASTLVNLGLLEAAGGPELREAALDHLTRGLALSEELGQTAWVANALRGLGQVQQASGDPESALASYDRLLELAGSTRNLQALIYGAIGKSTALQSLGRAAEAIAPLERARDTLAQFGEKPTRGYVILQLQAVHRALGDNEAALACGLEAIELIEASGSGSNLAPALSSTAMAYEQLGRLEEALAMYERVIELAQSLGDRGALAGTLVNAGGVLRGLGRLDEAEDRLTRGRELALELGHAVYVQHATTGLAHVRETRGDLVGATELVREALEGLREHGSPADVAAQLNRLGRLQEARRLLPDAMATFREALSLTPDGGDRATQAVANAGIALVAMGLGDRDSAIEHGLVALETFESIGDEMGLAGVLNTLGLVHASRGEYSVGLAHLDRAIAVAERGPARAALPTLLGSAGAIRGSLGDVERAVELSARALAALEETGPPAKLAGARVNLATALIRVGRVDEAAEQLERGRSGAAAAGDRAVEAIAALSLVRVHELRGDTELARRVCEEVVAICRELDDSVELARVLVRQAGFAFADGDPATAQGLLDEALPLAREARAIDVEVAALYARAEMRARREEFAGAVQTARTALGKLPLIVRGLAEEQGAGARDLFTLVPEIGILAAEGAGDGGALWEFVEAARATALLESLGGREALSANVVDPALARAEHAARAALATARAQATAARARRKLAPVREARKAVEAAEKQLLDVVARIQREAKFGGATTQVPATSLEAFQSTLASDEAYVVYVGQATLHRAFAFVVTARTAQIARIDVPDELQSALTSPRDRLAELAAARAVLVDPLGLPAEVRRVYVSPGGEFAYAPFSLLLSGREVVHVPSATTLLALRDADPGGGQGVLAVGDPIYRVDGSVHPGLAPLPGTRVEVEAVGTTRLLGEQATETAFVAAAAQHQRWRALHFACHGLLDSRRPLLSSLALSGDDTSDGHLTAAEVLRMDLPTDLVVLSACETGVGKVYRSEGVVGFTRAFLLAGSSRVIVSLWKVDDEATRALMTRFYELWKDRPAATALREAQEHVRNTEKWADPVYWAAWQLWGLP